MNKLGDPDRKVASKASFLLCQLGKKRRNTEIIEHVLTKNLFKLGNKDSEVFCKIWLK